MLKILRHKGVMKILLWCVAIVIILSFGIMSNAYLLSDQPGKLKYAGKVFGRKISVEDFEQNFQFMLFQARLQYGQNFDQIAGDLDLVKQTWDRILLLEQARRHRIKVSDNEVIQTIRKYPFFKNQNTGAFDPEIYQTVLRQGLRTTERTFEENIRNDLIIKKLFDRETFTASISDEEILDAYKTLNDKIRVSYVLFPRDLYVKDVPFDEIKAKNYFLDHKQDFIQPPTINVAYLQFPFDADNEDSKNQAYDRAFNALADLRNGKTFTEISQTYQTKLQESGFFDLQNANLSWGWPLETFQALFRMRIGDHTEIITTQNSYDIIQLQETRPAFHPPYNDIKEEVKAAYLNYEALKVSKQKAQEALTQFDPQGDFAATARSLNLDVQETPAFNLGQYLPNIGPGFAFQQTAFSLTKDDPLSGAVETEKGYAIIHFEERLPADMAKFEEEKNVFGQQLLMRKKIDLFNEYVAILKEKSNLEDLISDQLKQ